MWLIALASAPDIDYLIPALNSSAHHGLGITHSIAFSLILPFCTMRSIVLKAVSPPTMRCATTYGPIGKSIFRL